MIEPLLLQQAASGPNRRHPCHYSQALKVTMTDPALLHSQGSSYWKHYLAIRPKYADSDLYSRIFEYIAEHRTGTFDLAHDVACGPGQVAEQLAQTYKSVVASDLHAPTVTPTRTRLEGAGHSNINCIAFSAEDIDRYAEPESVDLITVAQAMPILDMPRALEGFHKVPKPKGTLGHVILWATALSGCRWRDL